MNRPPRMIVASEFWAGATARGLVRGIRECGWAVLEIDIAHYLRSGSSLAAKLASQLSRRRGVAAYNQAILTAAADHRADCFLTVKGGFVTHATLATLRASRVCCVNYYPDYHFNDVPIATMGEYDLVATTKSFQLEPLRRIMSADRVTFLHHGYTDGLHRLVPNDARERPIDVLYVGHASASKAAILADIAAAMPDLKIRIVGARWMKHVSTNGIRAEMIVDPLVGDLYAAEIARAKIVLAFHMGPDPVTGFADRVSTRTFEIPACGGFMLHVDNDEVRSLYSVPDEIETFTDADNCVAKIRYWLAHPEEREAVAARGHARAVPAYGYAARGRELALMIEQRLEH